MRRRVESSGLLTMLFIIVCFLVISGCKSYDQKEAEMLDTPIRGTINISADESFKPIVDAQIQVYESNYPGTHFNVQYKPEAECLKDFGTDSIRMVIATRGFTPLEEKFIVDSFRIYPKDERVARDAVAVIVHPLSPDSLFTMKDIHEILTGRFKKNLIPVFDGVQATSTVRYIVDSILKTDTLTSKAMAARTSEGVIDFVAKNPGTIGFIGVSWIGNKEDTAQVSFLQKVKIAKIESLDIPGNYVLPVQANIYMRRYPMVRDLVYILKENYRGLGYGFGQFLSGHIGQLIFKRAYLVPAKKKFTLRPVQLKE